MHVDRGLAYGNEQPSASPVSELLEVSLEPQGAIDVSLEDWVFGGWKLAYGDSLCV